MNRARCFRFMSALLCLLIFLTSTSSITAQGPERVRLPPLPGTYPWPSDGVDTLDLSFAALGYDGVRLERGRTARVGFNLPSFVEPLPGATLDFSYGYASDATEVEPELRLDFNDNNLRTLQLSESYSQETTDEIGLSTVPIAPGSNQLEFTLATNVECGVKQPEVRAWVYSTSTLHIPYRLIPMSPDLSRYPWPFFERAYRPIETYIVLPSDPVPADLSAAATIGAGLGKFSRGDAVVTTTLASRVNSRILRSYNVIFVGRPGSSRWLDQLDLPLPLDDERLEPDYGVVQEIQSPWNPYRMVLVVSGQTDQALARASQALNRESRFPGMSDQVAIVTDVLPPIPHSGHKRRVDLTFAEMGYEDQAFFGALRHERRVDFTLPRSFELLENPQLFLSFNHSQMINGLLSSLSVHLNEIPVGDVLLNASNVQDGLLEIDLPAWLLEAGRNELEIQVEMHLDPDEDICETADDPRLWTVIRSDSFIRLPYQAHSARPSLELFPYPFDENVNLTDVLVVLPPRPRPLELQILIDLAVNLGHAAGGDYIALNATTSDQISPEALNNDHVILVGRPSRNNLLRTMNDQLPQPFMPDADTFEPTLDTIVLLPDSAQSVGLLQEFSLLAPSQRYALAVTGTTDEGLTWAANTLLGSSRSLKGNVSVIQKTGVFHLDTRNVDRTREQTAIHKVAFDAMRWLALSRRWW